MRLSTMWIEKNIQKIPNTVGAWITAVTSSQMLYWVWEMATSCDVMYQFCLRIARYFVELFSAKCFIVSYIGSLHVPIVPYHTVFNKRVWSFYCGFLLNILPPGLLWHSPYNLEYYEDWLVIHKLYKRNRCKIN